MTESSETGGREAEIRAACLRISEHFMTTGATSLPAPVSPPGRRRPSRLPARLTAIAEPIGGAPLFQTQPFGYMRRAGRALPMARKSVVAKRCAVSDSASETLRRHFYTCDSASEVINHLLAPRQQSTTRARMG
jgi:hypothetical protein